MKKKATVTMDELLQQIAELATSQNSDRPQGYFTIEEAAIELFKTGKSCSTHAAKQKVFRSLQDLDAMGRLESTRIATRSGLTQRRGWATAYKVLPEKKGGVRAS